MNEDYFVLPLRENYFNFIEYTSDEQDLIPKTVYDYWGLEQFEFGKVGKCKEQGEWSFEEELRSIIYTLPKKPSHTFVI